MLILINRDHLDLADDVRYHGEAKQYFESHSPPERNSRLRPPAEVSVALRVPFVLDSRYRSYCGNFSSIEAITNKPRTKTGRVEDTVERKASGSVVA